MWRRRLTLSLDELRSKQREALQSASDWKLFKEDLEAKFKAALASLETEVRRKTGLELSAYSYSELPYFDSGADSCSIRTHHRGEWLTLRFPGLNKGVQVASLNCVIKRSADGSWQVEARETRSEKSDLLLQFTSHKPCIPLRIGWERNVWWGASADNGKLVEAVVDVLLDKDKPSEFVFKDPEDAKGCGFLLIIGLVTSSSVLAFTLLTV
jgi:hypothetical protein